jgi:hypothetical protein
MLVDRSPVLEPVVQGCLPAYLYQFPFCYGFVCCSSKTNEESFRAPRYLSFFSYLCFPVSCFGDKSV